MLSHHIIGAIVNRSSGDAMVHIPFDSLTSNNFVQFSRHINGRFDERSKCVAEHVDQLDRVHHDVLQPAAMSHVYNTSIAISLRMLASDSRH